MPLHVSPLSPVKLAEIIHGRAFMERKRRRKLKKPKRLRPPRGIILEYMAFLKSLLDEMHTEIRQTLYPALSIIDALSPVPTRDAIQSRQDAGADDALDEAMKTARARVAVRLNETTIRTKVQNIADKTGKKHREEFDEQVRSVIGVNPLVADSGLRAQMGLFVKEQVAQITSIKEESLSRVERLVNRGVRQGMRVEEMRDRIESSFNVSASKADLIARDQVLKFHGELTELRQREAGVDKYIWDTSKDDRVRDMHAELDGEEFFWDDPPVTNSNGDRNHPGRDYQCRCQALPVIDLETG